MANRRMFAKSVVQSSKFLRMPVSSRLLYYDIGMNADDDGYCEWYPVLQMSGAKEQDLQVLQANGFIRIFDNDVLIVTSWKENNLIKSDRYTPSKYLDKYNWNQVGTQVEPQYSIGKDSIGKDRLLSSEEPMNIPFLEFWKKYPKKVERKKAEQKWMKLTLEVQQRIILDIPARLDGEKWKKNDGQYIENPTTYLNGERWNDEIKPFIELQENSFKNRYIPENI